MGLRGYIAKRLLAALPIVFGIVTLMFIVSMVIPADPAAAAAGFFVPGEAVERLRKEYGLDKPVHVQYITYLSNLVKLDLGKSIHSRRPVIQDLAEYFPATIELLLVASAIGLAVGIPLGIVSAKRQNTLPDHFVRLLSLSGISMPSFWLGIIFLLIFFLHLGIAPGAGRIDPEILSPAYITGMYTLDSLLTLNIPAFISSLRHLVLPAVTLSFVIMGVVSRMTRATILETVRQDYMKTAKAKGVTDRMLFYKHALRNALPPINNVSGLVIANQLGEAFLVEYVFNWPGIGRYGVDSIMHADFVSIIAVGIVIGMTFLIMNLIVDIISAYIDPRITYE